MKKISLLLSLNALISTSASPEALLHERKNSNAAQENFTFEKEADGTLSELIVSSFLQDRKKAIKKQNFNWINGYSTEQQIFDIKWDPELHDIRMDIRREVSKDTSFVIINTFVEGSPEDFEGKNILESEQHLLKYILIKAYLSKSKESSLNHSTVILDKNTKIIYPPRPMITVLKNYFGETQELCKDRKSMQLVTIFNKQEFDDLIKKYFTSNNNNALPNSTSANNIPLGFALGAGSVAFAVLVWSTLNYFSTN